MKPTSIEVTKKPNIIKAVFDYDEGWVEVLIKAEDGKFKWSISAYVDGMFQAGMPLTEEEAEADASNAYAVSENLIDNLPIELKGLVGKLNKSGMLDTDGEKYILRWTGETTTVSREGVYLNNLEDK